MTGQDTNPERRAATEFGQVHEADGRKEISWFLEDEQASVEIVVRADGEMYAYLVGF